MAEVQERPDRRDPSSSAPPGSSSSKPTNGSRSSATSSNLYTTPISIEAFRAVSKDMARRLTEAERDPTHLEPHVNDSLGQVRRACVMIIEAFPADSRSEVQKTLNGVIEEWDTYLNSYLTWVKLLHSDFFDGRPQAFAQHVEALHDDLYPRMRDVRNKLISVFGLLGEPDDTGGMSSLSSPDTAGHRTLGDMYTGAARSQVEKIKKGANGAALAELKVELQGNWAENIVPHSEQVVNRLLIMSTKLRRATNSLISKHAREQDAVLAGTEEALRSYFDPRDIAAEEARSLFATAQRSQEDPDLSPISTFSSPNVYNHHYKKISYRLDGEDVKVVQRLHEEFSQALKAAELPDPLPGLAKEVHTVWQNNVQAVIRGTWKGLNESVRAEFLLKAGRFLEATQTEAQKEALCRVFALEALTLGIFK